MSALVIKMYERDNEIKALALTGLGSRAIANKLNMHNATVYRILKRLNLLTNKKNQYSEKESTSKIDFIVSDNSNISEAGETYFKYLCEASGYTCCVPSKHAVYDLLVDFGDGFKKIQVKTSKSITPQGYHLFTLVKKRHNSTNSKIVFYTKSEVDYFFLYAQDCRCWLIPFELVSNMRTVTPDNLYSDFEINLKCGWRDSNPQDLTTD